VIAAQVNAAGMVATMLPVQPDHCAVFQDGGGVRQRLRGPLSRGADRRHRGPGTASRMLLLER
jgi:hypothetical protein